MSEAVVRHRGGGFDADGNPKTATDATLTANAVAPGASREYVQRGRDGSNVAFTVYFLPEVDLADGDEVTVRGKRFAVQVEQWRSPTTARTGTVAICTGGTG